MRKQKETAMNHETSQPGHKHLCPSCGKATAEGQFDCEVDRDHDYELCDECAAAGVNLNA
jgi:hypothetical protein